MITIQQLLYTYLTPLLAKRSLSPDMIFAATQLRDCRTSNMGGHINSCPRGHEHQIAYNSCRHRLCSKCNGLPRERWLNKWKQKLLPVPHHHIVFTTPHELLGLWLYNKARFANTLFLAATQTLSELLADPKYLGAKPGILATLHTWSQTLVGHVHLHVLVTAGGLDGQGQWQVPKKDCLLPRKVLMIKFRGKLRWLLLRQLEQGELKVPKGTSVAYWRSQLHRVGRVVWNVKLFDRYAHGGGVATYLAQYMRGGPIGTHRLRNLQGDHIQFAYRLPTKHLAKPKHSLMRLHAIEFLARLLEHTPPRGFQTVRGYGLYSGNQHSRIAQAHAALGSRQLDDEVKELTWQQYLEQLGDAGECGRCSVCGEPLQSHSHFGRGREPPDITRFSPLVELGVA